MSRPEDSRFLLDSIFRHDEEARREPGSFELLGRLNAIDDRLEDDEAPAYNPEGLSADAVKLRLNTRDQHIRSVADYFVGTAPYAPDRCSDGRPEVEIHEFDLVQVHHIITTMRELGTQMLGGTGGLVIPYALATESYSDRRSTGASDFNFLIRHLASVGHPFAPGSHGKDLTTGSYCAKLAAQPKTVKKIADPDVRWKLREQSWLLVPDGMPEKVYESSFERVVEGAEMLNDNADNYFGLEEDAEEDTLYHSYGDDLMAEIHANHGEVVTERSLEAFLDEEEVIPLSRTLPNLFGAHNELVVVLNKRRGSTLHSTWYAAENGNEAQAFNIDVWTPPERGRAMFGDTFRRDIFTVGFAVDTIATAMTILRGDQELAIKR